MKDDTRPFKTPLRVKKIPRSIYVLISLLVVVIIILAALIFVNRQGIYDTFSRELITMQAVIKKITTVESEIRKKHEEVLQLTEDYKASAKEDISSSIRILHPGEEDTQFLKNKIEEEKDAASKALLNQILEQIISIAEAGNELKKLEAQLPEPHIVKKGENHFQICLEYLVEKEAVDKETALQLIDKDKLLESIVPGFKVWNLYTGREFATFVTRGDASISPEEVRRIAKQRLIAEKNRALKELNSLYFIIDTKKNLVKRDILDGGLFKPYRLKKVPDRHFKYSIDLRIRNKINIFASSLRIEKIEDIVLYPRFYKEGKDYKLTIRKDRRKALLTILNRNGLKKGRVVISVE